MLCGNDINNLCFSWDLLTVRRKPALNVNADEEILKVTFHQPHGASPSMSHQRDTQRLANRPAAVAVMLLHEGYSQAASISPGIGLHACVWSVMVSIATTNQAWFDFQNPTAIRAPYSNGMDSNCETSLFSLQESLQGCIVLLLVCLPRHDPMRNAKVLVDWHQTLITL